ncbi:D-alanyl-D-alanine carboxypeptidase family protein [Rhizobium sp. CFBP 13726]|uniref:D-alanyl-D-alanine carboxypeptidase family protein n=1 Tax=Rhizobium sp. CFBP 13726 TaxID=2775296 RepID=UPI00178108B5|nr:D-alanyl-D-alanine carboxypeptidase family protein [Rhizobium sp. CFBP 13726]
MANEEKKLSVDVIARIDKLEKGMAKAAGTVAKQSSVMEARTKSLATSMEGNITNAVTKVNGALGKLGLGGIAAGGIAGIVAGIGSIAKGIAEVGDQAKIAGVNVKAFQELKYLAEQSRIGVDSLTDGLKEMNLRADEFISTGAGSSAEAFQRLGYDSETLARKLKNPSDLFAEIIGRLKAFDKAAQIRIADEVFGGTGGEQFVKLIGQGEAGIRAQIKAANDLGIVMDEELIKRAEEIDRKFNTIATTVGTALKSAIVSAADSLSEFIDGFRDFQNQQSRTLDNRQKALGLRRIDLENQKIQTPQTETMARRKIDEQLRQLAEEEAKIVDVLHDRIQTMTRSAERTWTPPVAPPGGFGSTSTSTGKADLSSFLAAGKDASHVSGMSSSFEGKLEKMFADLPKELAGQLKINSGFRSNERQAELWQQALAKYGSVAEARKWVAPPGKSQHNAGNAADLGYGSSAAKDWAHQNASKYGLSFPLSNENWHIEDASARGKDMADKTAELEERGKSYDDIIAKARDFVAEQGIEASALDMTTQAAARLRYEQQLLNEARQAGVTLNPEQTGALKQLAADMAEAETRTRSLADSQEAAKEAAANFSQAAGGIAKGFVSDLIRGKTAADALKGALSSIADKMLDSALNSLFGGGSGPGGNSGGVFGSLISSIFGGVAKRENGDPVTAGKPYVVGEKRAELFVPTVSGRIVPRVPTAEGITRSAPASQGNQPGVLQVQISGASGDAHIQALVQQGVSDGLGQYNKKQERGGFGTMQGQFSKRKG